MPKLSKNQKIESSYILENFKYVIPPNGERCKKIKEILGSNFNKNDTSHLLILESCGLNDFLEHDTRLGNALSSGISSSPPPLII